MNYQTKGSDNEEEEKEEPKNNQIIKALTTSLKTI